MECADVIRELEELMLQGPQIEPPPELRQHFLECERCRVEWRELQESWLLMTAGLPSEKISSDLNDRVLARVKQGAVALPSPFSANPLWKYAVAASVLLVLVGGTFLFPKWILWNSTANQDLTRVTELARQMKKLQELERTFASPEFRYVSLTSVGSRDHVQGYLVYDFPTNVGHFFGYDLSDANGSTFVLWLLERDRSVIDSAVIDVNSEGVGAATISLPDNIDTLHEIVVSLESEFPAESPSNLLEMQSSISP